MPFSFSQRWQRAWSWYSSLKFGRRDTWTETQEVKEDRGLDLIMSLITAGGQTEMVPKEVHLYLQSWCDHRPWGRRSWWTNEPAGAKQDESSDIPSVPNTEACKWGIPSVDITTSGWLKNYCPTSFKLSSNSWSSFRRFTLIFQP